MAELRAFIVAHGRIPHCDRQDSPVTHHDLAIQAHGVIFDAWWPVHITNPLPVAACDTP